MMTSARQDGLNIRPLMIAAMVILWLWTAFVSLGPGHEWGMRMMAETGATPTLSNWAIIAGSVTDAVLGIGLMIRPWRKVVLQAQIALMLSYTLIITALIPHYWFDPYAGVAKNLVLVVATLWLIRTEPQR